MNNPSNNTGLSLVELLISVSIAGLIMLSINGMLAMGLQSAQATQKKNALTRQAQFAMNLMVKTIQESPRLLLPLANSPIRGDTADDHGVVAVTLNHIRDLDGNGIPDADNDGDGLFDEDLPDDANNDGRRGIAYIDDDKKYGAEFSSFFNNDDDEDYAFLVNTNRNEDWIDGVDNDNDGLIDEDPPADMNNDGCSGACDVDEDGDGNNNEDAAEDDDEDEQSDEDWYDSVVFYEKNGNLYQRTPVPWDENTDGSITGKDYIESILVENVSSFVVTRLTTDSDSTQIVDLKLDLTNPDGEIFSLNTQVRIRGF